MSLYVGLKKKNSFRESWSCYKLKNMHLTRRQIIQLGLGSLLLPGCLRKFPLSATESSPVEVYYFGFGSPENKTYQQKNAGFMSYDFRTTKTIPLENEIHSIAYSETLGLKVFMPKIGKHAYFQRGNEPLKVFTSIEGKYFYGHGAFDEKRGLFYTTQATSDSSLQRNQMKDKGEIIVHSLKDFSVTGSFASYGNNPHDLRIVNDQLLVCNGGENSNLAIINLEDHKLIKDFSVNDKNISFGHLEIIDNQNFIIASGNRHKSKPCPLYLVNSDSGLKQAEIPFGMEGEFVGQLLSVLHHDGIIYATCPATHKIFCWDNNGHFVSTLTINEASSLAYSKLLSGVIVGSGDKPEKLKLLKQIGNLIIMKEIEGPELSTGAHSLIINT